ncbi:ArsR/SmtB family transcription factor [Actinomycetota bacterium]
MTVSGPKVRDFTDKQRSLSVTVESDAVYEVLLALFVFHGETEHDQYEVGSELALAVQDGADEQLIADIKAMGSWAELGLPLIGVAHDLPTPRTVAGLVAEIRQMDPAVLRSMLMACCGVKPSHGHDTATIERAAQGDTNAVRELFESLPHTSDIGAVLEREPEQMREDIASVIERFGAAVGPYLAERQAVLDRDAAATVALAKTMSPDRLVEKVTNGITFEMQPQVSGVLLIPSVAIRPWVVISEHKTLRVFCYSVADEHLDADPDAPPAYLVNTLKALGDERRLRILGILAEGDLGLKELAERVDLAKSTAHHHMGILRRAGLVRVIIGRDDQRYSLRDDAVPETGRLLETFLAARPVAEKDPREDKQ